MARPGRRQAAKMNEFAAAALVNELYTVTLSLELRHTPEDWK